MEKLLVEKSILKSWFAAMTATMATHGFAKYIDEARFKARESMRLVLESAQEQKPIGVVATDGHEFYVHWAEKSWPELGTNLYSHVEAKVPWGFHIQFNNGKDATFKGFDKLAECEALLECDETITMLYSA